MTTAFDLMGDLADISGKLFRHIQEGDYNADSHRKALIYLRFGTPLQ